MCEGCKNRPFYNMKANDLPVNLQLKRWIWFCYINSRFVLPPNKTKLKADSNMNYTVINHQVTFGQCIPPNIIYNLKFNSWLAYLRHRECASVVIGFEWQLADITCKSINITFWWKYYYIMIAGQNYITWTLSHWKMTAECRNISCNACGMCNCFDFFSGGE